MQSMLKISLTDVASFIVLVRYSVQGGLSPPLQNSQRGLEPQSPHVVGAYAAIFHGLMNFETVLTWFAGIGASDC